MKNKNFSVKNPKRPMPLVVYSLLWVVEDIVREVSKTSNNIKLNKELLSILGMIAKSRRLGSHALALYAAKLAVKKVSEYFKTEEGKRIKTRVLQNSMNTAQGLLNKIPGRF